MTNSNPYQDALEPLKEISRDQTARWLEKNHKAVVSALTLAASLHGCHRVVPDDSQTAALFIYDTPSKEE